MPKIINKIKMEPFNLIKNIDAPYELWGKKKNLLLEWGGVCTKNYWSLSNCRYVKVTPYMGIYIILETGIRPRVLHVFSQLEE